MLLRKKLLIVLLLLFSPFVYADFAYPVLVFDAENTTTLPKHFRLMDNPLPKGSKVSSLGMKIAAMGSGQFSENQLMEVIKKVNPKSLMIIDLRQESHGFLNGDAISWYGINDQANIGKTPLQVEQDQFQRLSSLQALASVTLYQITQKSPEGKIIAANPITLQTDSVFAESDLTRAYNFGYTRIYVTDHKKPDDTQVNQFVSTVQSLPAPTWVYFHCRAGEGRTTTFMAMLDMMHNASKVSFEDIIMRQAMIGGTDLSIMPSRTDINYQNAVERYQFLQDFYDYAKAGAFSKVSWTTWQKQHISKGIKINNTLPTRNKITLQPPDILKQTTPPATTPPAKRLSQQDLNYMLDE